MLVLPSESSEEARILTLGHPRTSKPCRYYFDPSHGIFEFTRIAAPKAVCRSWLLKRQSTHQFHQEREEGKNTASDGHKTKETRDELGSSQENCRDNVSTPKDYIAKDAELLVATSIDPLFVVLPSLTERKLFLSADDLLDSLSEISKHFPFILRTMRIREQIEARLKVVCDSVDAGDEKMYRLNDERLLAELTSKAERMVASGLPASMEERFVKRALETPLKIVQREESFVSVNGTNTPQSEGTTAESVESQTSTATIDSRSSFASAVTEITIPEDPAPDDGKSLHHLLRVRKALCYMIDSYTPKPLADSLTAMIASGKSPIDFSQLETRLADIAKLKAETLVARSAGDFSRKRNMYEEDDLIEGRLEKKKRIEEEEKKRKATETRGTRDLKKVNTKGMKKMSDFFGKRTSPRKKA